MTAQEFTYWLQGFSEINGATPTQAQWKIIQDHLQLVFKKVTPKYDYALQDPNRPNQTKVGPIVAQPATKPTITC